MEAEPYSPPRLIFWETTAGCNLECIHCRRVTVADQLLPQNLTTAEAKAMIDDIAAFSKPIFVLSGGEPLFRPDIYEIARHAADAGLIVALATNGTLIDAGVAQKIKDAGIRRVSVSFDGADAPTHDIFRGPGALDRALQGIGDLRAALLPPRGSATRRGSEIRHPAPAAGQPAAPESGRRPSRRQQPRRRARSHARRILPADGLG